MNKRGLKVVTADDTGLVKVTNVNDESVVATFGKQSFENGIEQLQWYTNESSVVATRKSGTVDILSLKSGEVTVSSKELAGKTIVGLQVTRQDEVPRVVTATGDGVVQCWSLGGETPVLHSTNQAGNHIEQMRCRGIQFAVGGKEQLLQLCEMGQKKAVWKAKNVRNDKYDLRVPVWVRDLSFFPNNEGQIATVTAHRHMRIYDTRAQRRPVQDFEVGPEQLNCLTIDPSGTFAYTADGNANVQQIDLRAFKKIGRYRGYVGAVNCLSLHPTESVLAGVGLGRHLVVHSTKNKRKPLHNIYMKQKLTACLFSAETIPSEESKRDDEDVWDTLDGDSERPTKRRKVGDG